MLGVSRLQRAGHELLPDLVAELFQLSITMVFEVQGSPIFQGREVRPNSARSFGIVLEMVFQLNKVNALAGVHLLRRVRLPCPDPLNVEGRRLGRARNWGRKGR